MDAAINDSLADLRAVADGALGAVARACETSVTVTGDLRTARDVRVAEGKASVA